MIHENLQQFHKIMQSGQYIMNCCKTNDSNEKGEYT